MIVYKKWIREKKRSIFTYETQWEGWFLFGIIPLYVRQVTLTATR